MSTHAHHHDHSGHSHGHGHGHSHAPTSFGRAFAIAITLNLVFVIVEAGAGFWTGSMALLADAGHNLSDVLGLVVAWIGSVLARRPASKRFTYGLRGSTILAAMLNALFLLVAIGAIVLAAIQRFSNPQPIEEASVIIVALIGIVINAGTAALFMKGRHSDLNIRGAYLHMAADAGVSAGVVLAGLAIMFTGAVWIDPAISLLIAGVIFWGTWGLLNDSVALSLAGVPAQIDRDAVEKELLSAPGVSRVHDLHIWAMSTTEAALTAHLIIPQGHPGDAFLNDLNQRLSETYGIHHVTIQIETGDGAPCLVMDTGCG